jgi:hypothetical protein
MQDVGEMNVDRRRVLKPRYFHKHALVFEEEGKWGLCIIGTEKWSKAISVVKVSCSSWQ